MQERMRLISQPLPLALTDALSSIVQSHLPKVLTHQLQVLVAELKEQHLRAYSNSDAQAFEDVVQFCNTFGHQIVVDCVASIRQGLQLKPSFAQQMLAGVDELALVEDAEIEDQLLMHMVVRNIRDSLADQERNICACFSQLAGQYIVNFDNPLSLDYLIRSWLAEFKIGKRPESVRAVFKTQICAVLPLALAPYFKALAAQFALQRIAPLLPPKFEARKARKPTNNTFAPEMLDAAIHHLRPVSVGGHPLHNGNSGLLASVTETMLKQLLQAPVPSGGWSAESLLQHIERNGVHFNQRQRNNTHLVISVFKTLQHEHSMAMSLRPSLQKLLLPVLQATLLEPAAISRSSHPVRATLDRLLRLAEACDPPNHSLEMRLEALIGKISDGWQRGVHSFSAFDPELDDLIDIQQRTYRRSAERVMQLYRGQDMLMNAKREVARGLYEVLGGEAPALLIEWLDSGWRELLVHESIRARRDNISSRADLALTGLLARYLKTSGAHLSEADWLNRRHDIERLLGIMRRRISEFGITSTHISSMLKLLRAQMLSEKSLQMYVLEVPVGASTKLDPGLQCWQQQLGTLQEGDWLQDAQGRPLQLVWHNAQKDHYVLVNSKGTEAGSLSVAELSSLVSEGQLLIGESASGGQSVTQRILQDVVGRLYQEVAHARSYDDLTGLLNRQSFEGAVAKSLSTRNQPAYLTAQIDQFKVLNNHAGLLAGDACLKQIAKTIAQMLPKDAVLGRVGGVEFAAIIPACSERRAWVFAEELRATVETQIFHWQGQSHAITLSIGVVEAGEHHDVASILGDLQAACNIAKELGRNRVHRYSATADDARVGLLSVAARIDDIIQREDISLRVQQIAPADSHSPEVPHYELLLVMENELRLKDFIAAAERYNRMAKVDRWVVERIFSELAQAPQLWGRCSSLAINLSGSSLNDDRMLGFIEGLFGRYSIDPQRMYFEITETAAVANLAKTAELIRQLQSIGCSFAIDDFGVGFSSFDYLKRLPVDLVKIDGSFVKEVAHSANDLAMVRSINEIAHALGRKTVAEYVENSEVRTIITEIGVDYVQGFGVQMPRKLKDFMYPEGRASLH